MSFSLPTFSPRTKLNVDRHTSVALVSCMSIARDSDTEGDVCHRQVHHKSWVRTFQSRRQLVRAPISNQEGNGNFVRAPLQSRRQLSARAPFNQECNFVHTPISICQATLNIDPFIVHPCHIIRCVHYSLCALFICAHCSIVLSLTLIKES